MNGSHPLRRSWLTFGCVCSLVALLLWAGHLYFLGIVGRIDGGTMLLYPFFLRVMAIVCMLGLIRDVIVQRGQGNLLRLTLLAALIGMFTLYTMRNTLYWLGSNGLRHQLSGVGGVDKLQTWAEGTLASAQARQALIKAATDGDMETALGMLPQNYHRFFSEFLSFRAVDNDLGEMWIVCAQKGHQDYTYGLLIGARASVPPKQYGYLVRIREGVYVWHREF
jgi:hypothetical protein